MLLKARIAANIKGLSCCFSNGASTSIFGLYTRYPIVARRAWPLGRVRRASKGILHTIIWFNFCYKKSAKHYQKNYFSAPFEVVYKIPLLSRALGVKADLCSRQAKRARDDSV